MQIALAPTTTCNARKRNGEPCQNVAGFRTEHYGEGRCYLHGGRTPRGVDSPHWKGAGDSPYVEVIQKQLGDKIALLDAYDPLDLMPEAQFLRALLLDALERMKANPTPAEVTLLVDLVERIGRMVERIVKMRNDTAITAAEVKLIAARLADIVSRYIPDEEQQQKFMREVFSIGIGGT